MKSIHVLEKYEVNKDMINRSEFDAYFDNYVKPLLHKKSIKQTNNNSYQISTCIIFATLS